LQLSVREVSRILRVSEGTVLGWVKEQGLPAREVNGLYWVNRSELVEWATIRKISFDPVLLQEANGAGLNARLDDALQAGGVRHDVGGTDRDAVLRSLVAALPLASESDRDLILQVFRSREAAGSTDLGNGIAIPHPRYPVVLPVPRPSITLCFLQQPIAYGPAGNPPVHTLFALLSPTVRIHLQLLARLSSALRDAGFLAAVQQKQGAEEILQQARRVEASFHPPSAVESRKGL
jgi:PTS system nitrogen regulatory IIA component